MPRKNRPAKRDTLPAETRTTHMGKVPAAAVALRGLAQLGESLGLSPKLVAACDAGADTLDRLTDRANGIKGHLDAVADATAPIVADAVNAVRSAPSRARKETP